MISFASCLDLVDQFYPRMMSSLDRDVHSSTYGSCDRYYWMYKMHDINSGVLQQSSLSLAYLVLLAKEHAFHSCSYLKAGNEKYWSDLALAINRFTVREFSRRNNLLDEYYPGEASFPGSSFAAYATLKSADILGQAEIIEAPIWSLVAEKFLNKGITSAANQDIAAAAFLAMYSKLLRRKGESLSAHLQLVLERKQDDGNYFEYGGIDLGYASVTLNYLCCLQDSIDYDISRHIVRLLRSIAPFISRSGQYGGEYTSRQTAYALPYGFVKAAALEPDLSDDVTRLDLKTLFLKLDDRYLLHYCLASLVMATYELRKLVLCIPTDSKVRSEESAFVGKQLYYYKNNRFDLFLATNKGGSFYYESGNRILHESAYRIVDTSGNVYCSNVIQKSRYSFQDHDNRVHLEVDARFFRFKNLQPSSLHTVALRLLRPLGPLLNRVFKNLLIVKPSQHESAVLKRSIIIDKNDSSISVHDHVVGLAERDRLYMAAPSSFRLVPSSRLYQIGEEDAFSKAIECNVHNRQFVRDNLISCT